MYKKKFSLVDIYECGYLDGYLPSYKEPTTREKKTKLGNVEVFNKMKSDSLAGQIVSIANSSGVKITNARYTRRNVHLYVGSDWYAWDYNKIVNAIQDKKNSLMYANLYKNEIANALTYSLNSYVLGKPMPKLALRINSLAEIKGMTKGQKRALMYNVIESILFDDDFDYVQKKMKLNKREYRINATSSATWANNQSWDKLKQRYERRLQE